MDRDVECPYCGAGNDICHDDGYGYEEDCVHEQECDDCCKVFAYTTSVSYYHQAHAAECLNGADHRFEPVQYYPPVFPDAKRCRDCGLEERGRFDWSVNGDR